jgi:7-keto-8-aminopelargonate synthetase-like enzyme
MVRMNTTSAAISKATKVIGACCVGSKALAPHYRLRKNSLMTKPFSPAAQAVLDATGRKTWYRNDDIAAALRAAASQLAYGHTDHPIIDEKALLAIADELEAQ